LRRAGHARVTLDAEVLFRQQSVQRQQVAAVLFVGLFEFLALADETGDPLRAQSRQTHQVAHLSASRVGHHAEARAGW